MNISYDYVRRILVIRAQKFKKSSIRSPASIVCSDSLLQANTKNDLHIGSSSNSFQPAKIGKLLSRRLHIPEREGPVLASHCHPLGMDFRDVRCEITGLLGPVLSRGRSQNMSPWMKPEKIVRIFQAQGRVLLIFYVRPPNGQQYQAKSKRREAESQDFIRIVAENNNWNFKAKVNLIVCATFSTIK